MRNRLPPFGRSRPRSWQRIAITIALVLVIVGIRYAQEREQARAPAPKENAPQQVEVERRAPAPSGRPQHVPKADEPPTETARIQRVVDGDTLLLANGERLRLIGVDTPETVKEGSPVEAWGPEASAFTKDFVKGRSVKLEYDVERRDHYGRLLAYVWVGDRMLNEELLREGLARVLKRETYSQERKQRFISLEADARREKVGMWSKRGSR